MIVINALTIIAAPVIGAHYVIDIIGGVALAAGSILLAKHLFRIHASRNAADAVANSSDKTMPQLVLSQG
jgi:membrane-associated phospholipid phosphatase